MRIAAVAAAALALALGQATGARAAARIADGPAATPPMGWNSWNTFGCGVTEQDIRQAADALVASGMRDAGYRYVVVDDCWFDPDRDAAGRLRADPDTFPSGIAALAAYVHARGLRFGIYEAPLEKTCAQVSGSHPGATGSLGHEELDAQTFANWGVDYLKYDYCSGSGSLADQIAVFTRMRDALRATGRPIVYSINPNSLHTPTGAAYDWSGVANLVRTSEDLVPWWDTASLQDVFVGIANGIAIDGPLAARAGPGHWNDPDMLVVGTQAGSYAANLLLSARVPQATAALTALLTSAPVAPTLEEMRTHFAMWAILAAPLIAGGDVRQMTPAVRAILTNAGLIAVDQDPLGAQGRPVRADGAVWAKRLRDGAVAAALFNASTTPATIATTARELGLPAATRYAVDDLWSGAHSQTTGALRADVPAHGVAVFRVTSERRPASCPPQRSIRIHLPRGLAVRSVRVSVTGGRTRVLRGPRRSVLVVLAGRPHATYRVRIAIRTARDATLVLRRTFHTCQGV